MYEYPGRETSVKMQSQSDMDKQFTGNQILDDVSIREFIELLRKQGMENEAQFLDDMFKEMGDSDKRFSDMNKKIQEFQSKIEQFHGETSSINTLKSDFFFRATQMRFQLDELSQCFLDAKDSLVAISKEGLQKFAEVGKSALHQACVSMCNGGIRYFENVMMGAHKNMENNENILKHLNDLKDSAKDTKEKRTNLVRAIFRRSDITLVNERENAFLRSIRSFAEHGVRFYGTKMNLSAKIIDMVESVRDNQLAAVKKNPSLDTLIQTATAKAEQVHNNMKNKFKSHDNSGPDR